jgi:ankyrin repeat protein
VVRLLREKGADVKVEDCSGRTVLYWAARGRHEAMVQQLLENGADIDVNA